MGPTPTPSGLFPRRGNDQRQSPPVATGGLGGRAQRVMGQALLLRRLRPVEGEQVAGQGPVDGQVRLLGPLVGPADPGEGAAYLAVHQGLTGYMFTLQQNEPKKK